MDSIDLPAAKAHNITVVNTPDAHVDAVAELTLAGILATLRKRDKSGEGCRLQP